MDVDNAQAATDADDLYDQDILTDEKCPACGKFLYIGPDCISKCSDSNCSFDGIAEYRKEAESHHVRIDA